MYQKKQNVLPSFVHFDNKKQVHAVAAEIASKGCILMFEVVYSS